MVIHKIVTFGKFLILTLLVHHQFVRNRDSGAESTSALNLYIALLVGLSILEVLLSSRTTTAE